MLTIPCAYLTGLLGDLRANTELDSWKWRGNTAFGRRTSAFRQHSPGACLFAKAEERFIDKDRKR